MRATTLVNLLPPPSSPPPAGKRREGAFTLLLLLLAFALIWVCRIFGAASIRQLFERVPLETPVDLLLLLASVLAAIMLHEAGHLLASLMLGFQVLGASIGPLQIQILPGEWKVSWSWKTTFTGSISAIPRGMNHWRGAMITVISAGPSATLATGLWAATFNPPGHTGTVCQIYFVQVSMLLFFLGLIPNGKQARRQNDARLLVDLLKHNDGADEMELKVRLKQHVLAGDRPRDYPRELLIRLRAFRGRPEGEVLFAQAISQWAMDSDETELADAWDTRALAIAEQCTGPMRNSALASSACFDVIFRGDGKSALGKFEQVDFAALFPASFAYRARAAQQMACGRLHRVPGLVLRAQYALPRGMAHYALERNLLERLHMKALTGEPRTAKFKSASA